MWLSLIVSIAMFLGLACESAFRGTPPPRAHLDALWEKHMLAGSFVVLTVDGSKTTGSEKHPDSLVDPKSEVPIYPSGMSHPISILSEGEGLFGTGGWILAGGLLRRISDGPVTIEIYGKRVIRRFPHFPFPPHSSGPEETGYEFFLLHRKSGSLGRVIRKWVFLPEETVIDKDDQSDVRCIFQYDSVNKTAAITLRGLKRPFEDRVDLLAILGSSKPGENDWGQGE